MAEPALLTDDDFLGPSTSVGGPEAIPATRPTAPVLVSDDDFFKPPRAGILETAGAIATQLGDVVTHHIPGGVAAVIEGSEPGSAGEFADSLVRRSRAQSKLRTAEAGPERPTSFPFASTQDIAGLGQSMGASLPSTVGGLVAGVGTGAVAGPIAGTMAGMAASGGMAYRSSVNQFTRDLRDSVDEDRAQKGLPPISNDEFAAKKAAIDPLITEYGLWEAVPEAAGNAMGFGIIKAPIKGAIGKVFGSNVLVRTGTKLGALYGEELATETVTQHGQHNTEGEAKQGLGVKADAPRSWASPSDLATSFGEVAGPTILQTTLMAGGVKAGQMAYDRNQSAQPITGPIPVIDTSVPPPGASAVEQAFAGAPEAVAPPPVAPVPDPTIKSDPAQPATPAMPVAPPEAPVLQAYGYSPEQIAAMPPEQRAAEYQDAVAAGVVALKGVENDSISSAFEQAIQGTPEAAAVPQVQAPVPQPVPPAQQIAPPVQPEPPPGEPYTRDKLEALLADPRSVDEIKAEAEAQRQAAEPGQAEAAAFRPSTEWQVLPDALDQTTLPPGLDGRSTADGKTEVRFAPPVGTKEAPVTLDTPEAVHAGAEITNPTPTPAQAEAGNYQKRHVKLHGLDISVETEQGGERVAADGSWRSPPMPAPYGHVLGTKGADGDPLDITIGPNPAAKSVFVIDQVDPDSRKFDEHKSFAGFDTADQAQAAYDGSFSDASGPFRAGAITEMSVAQWKAWTKGGNHKKPVAYTAPRAEPKRKVLSLFEFLASIGGIKDHGGELRHMGLDKVFIPGFGRLVRANGKDLDTARESAAEIGYMPKGTRVNALLDLLRQEAAGQRVYSEADVASAQDREQQRVDRASNEQYQQIVDDVHSLAQEQGVVGLNDNEAKTAARLHLVDGMDLDDALVESLIRTGLAEHAESVETAISENQSDDWTNPFDVTATHEAGAGLAPTGDRTAGPQAEQAAGASPGVSEHGDRQQHRGDEIAAPAQAEPERSADARPAAGPERPTADTVAASPQVARLEARQAILEKEKDAALSDLARAEVQVFGSTGGNNDANYYQEPLRGPQRAVQRLSNQLSKITRDIFYHRTAPTIGEKYKLVRFEEDPHWHSAPGKRWQEWLGPDREVRYGSDLVRASDGALVDRFSSVGPTNRTQADDLRVAQENGELKGISEAALAAAEATLPQGENVAVLHRPDMSDAANAIDDATRHRPGRGEIVQMTKAPETGPSDSQAQANPADDLEIPEFLRRPPSKGPVKAASAAPATPAETAEAQRIEAGGAVDPEVRREADLRWRNWVPGKNAKGETVLTRPRLATFIKEVRDEQKAAAREAKKAEAAAKKKPAAKSDAMLSIGGENQSVPLFDARRDLTSQAFAARPQLEQQLTAVVRGIAGDNVRVEFPDEVRLKNENLAAWGSMAKGHNTAAGVYYPADRLIRVALNDPRHRHVASTTLHESFHAVEHLLLSDAELAVLKRAEPSLREIIRNYLKISPQQATELADFEVRAIAFEAYVHARTTQQPMGRFPAAVRAIMEKLHALFERIRNTLHGLGFKSASDVFTDTFEGKMVGREPNARPIGPSAQTGAKASLASPDFMDTVASALPADRAMTAEEINKAAGTDRLNHVKVALRQLVEEGRAVREGTMASYRYRRIDDGQFAVRSGEGDMFETVQTPDGPRQQGVIPGAEKITDKERAQRGADKPLKPGKPQKSADEGLFGDEHKQGSLFSMGQGAPQLPLHPHIDPTPEVIAARLEEHNWPRLAAISSALRFGKINTVEARTKFQDKFIRWKNIQEDAARSTGNAIPESLNVYQAESLYYGRTGQRLDALDQNHIDPLIEDIKARKLTLEEVDEFLMARHAPERNANLRKINPDIADPSGISDAKAASILKKIDDSGRRADFDAVEKRVRALIDETGQTLVKGGLISAKTPAQWKAAYQNYVPLRGWAEGPNADEGAPGMGVGRGYDIRGKESKQALGRGSVADGPLAYVMLQAQQAVIRTEKNRVALTALRFVQQHPDTDLWKIDKGDPKRKIDPASGLVVEADDPTWIHQPNVFAAKIDGVPHYINFQGEYGPNLARALKNLGTANMPAALRLIATFTRLQARLATSWNPDFMIPNFVRDAGEAFINLQAQDQKRFVKQFSKHLLPAIRGSFQAITGKDGGKYAEAFREFDEAGGRIRFFGLENVEDIKANIAAKMRRLEGGALNNMRAAGEAAITAIEIANGSIENATRLAAYMAARDVGLSKARAASIARELTVNFNRKGELGAIVSALYMFANASAQGTVRMLQGLKGSKRVRRFAYGIGAAGAAMALYNLGAGGDDDDGESYYTKIPFWERDTNLLVMWPKGWGHDGKFIKIPLPYGFAFFHVIGARSTTMAMKKEPAAKAIPAMIGSVVDAFDPLGRDANRIAQFAPTLARPAIHLYTNRNWTGRPINPDPMPWNKSEPDSSRFFKSASPFSITAAQKVNQWTGGTKHQPGLLDWSPGSIDNVLGFVTGGLGRFVLNTSSTAWGAYQGTEWQPDKTPILRRFYGGKADAADQALYFDDREKVMAAHQRMTAFAKDKDDDGRKRIETDQKAELAAYGEFKKADDKRAQLRREIDEIKADDKLSAVQREQKIKAKQKEELTAMGEARAKLKAVRNEK